VHGPELRQHVGHGLDAVEVLAELVELDALRGPDEVPELRLHQRGADVHPLPHRLLVVRHVGHHAGDPRLPRLPLLGIEPAEPRQRLPRGEIAELLVVALHPIDERLQLGDLLLHRLEARAQREVLADERVVVEHARGRRELHDRGGDEHGDPGEPARQPATQRAQGDAALPDLADPALLHEEDGVPAVPVRRLRRPGQ
jgi:hypothetical protein